MPITSTQTDNTIRIKTDERFDYSAHTEFRNTYRDSDANCEYIIDMAGTAYMDSSALGMMLLLREYAGSDNANISIVGCNPEIKKILEISKFDKLFKIS